MSQVLRCDECPETAIESAALHWWRVDRVGTGPDYHFCSAACLSNWADNQ